MLFVIGMLTVTVVEWVFVSQYVRQQVRSDALILLDSMNAVRQYTSDHVRPLLADDLETNVAFIPETVPSYSAHSVFRFFQEREENFNFSYREAAPNPTNPRDLSDAFELGLFNEFVQNDDLTELVGFQEREGNSFYYVARPMRVGSESCLECHSTPDVAPASLIATYGSENGFNWELGEVIATQVIYVPTEDVQADLQSLLLTNLYIFTPVLGIIILLINWIIRSRVVRPVLSLGEVSRSIGEGNQEIETLSLDPLGPYIQRQDEVGDTLRAFEQMQAEIIRVNQVRSRFFTNFSHELRTPLNSILNVSKAVSYEQQGPLNEDQKNSLSNVVQSANHLLNLINDILDMGKIEAGATELFWEDDIDVRHIIDEVLDVSSGLLPPDNRVALVTNIPDDIPMIRADYLRVKQILLNLVSNAIKFTEEGRVSIAVKRPTAA
ncbi:MAG: DUF3365 domain-containing protein, partial [Chloroflexota bacterium]